MKRGEIWQVNLNPTLGVEIQKSRPSIIVGDERIGILPLRVIVPITGWNPKYGVAKWIVKLEPDSSNNLTKLSAADCLQVRSVSQIRFVRKIGEVSADKLEEVEAALRVVLKL